MAFILSYSNQRGLWQTCNCNKKIISPTSTCKTKHVSRSLYFFSFEGNSRQRLLDIFAGTQAQKSHARYLDHVSQVWRQNGGTGTGLPIYVINTNKDVKLRQVGTYTGHSNGTLSKKSISSEVEHFKRGYASGAVAAPIHTTARKTTRWKLEHQRIRVIQWMGSEMVERTVINCCVHFPHHPLPETPSAHTLEAAVFRSSCCFPFLTSRIIITIGYFFTGIVWPLPIAVKWETKTATILPWVFMLRLNSRDATECSPVRS